ncbi:MAG: hypothetical protein LBT11_04050 [Treponema sp.]|jgi:hypothetical protein|nr:hypothetical protein [Treponema sp.]
MNSSRTWPFYGAPFYGAVAVYTPLSLLAVMLPLAAVILRAALPELVFRPVALAIPAVLSALGASLYHSLLQAKASDHKAANIRGAIVCVILVYGTASLLCFGIPLRERFFPNLVNSFSALVVLYVWSYVLVMRRLFDAWLVFDTHRTEHSGDPLRKIMLEEAERFTSTETSLGKIEKLYAAQLVLLLIAAAVSAFIGIGAPIGVYIILAIVCINTVLLFALAALFRREHAYAGEGLALASPDRAVYLAGIAVCILSTAAAALLLSLGNNILPVSMLTDFLRWFWAWFSGLFKGRERLPLELPPLPEPVQAIESMPPMGMPDFMVPGNYQPSPFWDWVKYAAIAAVILAFIWFMIKPLLSRGRSPDKTLSLGAKIRRLAAEWWRVLKSALGSWLGFLKANEKQISIGRIDETRVRRLSEELLAGYSPQKRREMKASVTLFSRLIIWGGETLQVPWQPAYAPGEYCARLKASLTVKPDAQEGAGSNAVETSAAIIRCGELFEEALYAAEVLSDKKRQEFRNLVEQIT